MSIEIKNGKAFQVTADVEITQQEMLERKKSFEQGIATCDIQIAHHQNLKAETQTKLTECEAICTTLGY